ncbi:3'(2'),5'-bisphosphate nucleotidase CysQ [Phreatobacter sp.]|uniref:3'(2'),5'-bisphosphate nucleotidase CysQ n=1 Tax=Phreatobacter sp. TaxID=1966341 RepID=UPI003F6FA978
MPAAEDLVLRDLLASLAAEAGAMAQAYARRGMRTWTKAKASPVTEADIAVDSFLKERLTAARPGFGWLSEETIDDPARLDRREVFIVDPIDGTRAFAAGLPDWTVSLAAVRDGRPVAAALAEPVAGRVFAAALGHGATVNGRRLVPGARESLAGARVAGPIPMLAGPKREGAVLLPKIHSLALRFAKVAVGEIDAGLAGGASHDWDLAAADLLVHEAGAALTGLDGAVPVYNRPVPVHSPLICAAPALHALLRQHA